MSGSDSQSPGLPDVVDDAEQVVLVRKVPMSHKIPPMEGVAAENDGWGGWGTRRVSLDEDRAAQHTYQVNETIPQHETRRSRMWVVTASVGVNPQTINLAESLTSESC